MHVPSKVNKLLTERLWDQALCFILLQKAYDDFSIPLVESPLIFYLGQRQWSWLMQDHMS